MRVCVCVYMYVWKLLSTQLQLASCGHTFHNLSIQVYLITIYIGSGYFVPNSPTVHVFAHLSPGITTVGKYTVILDQVIF